MFGKIMFDKLSDILKASIEYPSKHERNSKEATLRNWLFGKKNWISVRFCGPKSPS